MIERPRPVYRHTPAKVPATSLRRVSVDLVENIFFGLVMLLCFGVGIVLFIQGVKHPIHIFWFILFWGLMAYLALPRLHRILTAMYLPDYFIGRARTSTGLLGDPVNLALRGTEEQVHDAMERAGWVRADDLNLGSARRIVTSSLLRRSYPEAPVSPLMLFGHQQAFAYQQEVEGNPAQRHHVRFWPAPEGWLLPGGHHVDWVAAGTYDRRVGLSLFTFEITHKIDRDTDVERDYIIATLTHTSPGIEVEIIEDFSTGYHCRNGGGDAIETDGDLPIVDLSYVSGKRMPVPVPNAPRKVREAVAAGNRPIGIVTGTILVALSLVVSTLHAAFGFDSAVSTSDLPLWTRVALGFLPAVLGALLLWPTWRGSQLARLALVAVLTLGTLGQVVDWLAGEAPVLRTLVVTGADLLALYSFTSQTVREWTQRRSPHTTLGTGTVTLDPIRPEVGE
ncbi:LssY C-terminal domain-containing protein [Aestuariimicrobium ganziense]|uniref:LssY C-terminal domain-containing protein n=1 Tax=Aestuariimicrobium ganziense TaxID=2773677 RepID=UPI002E2826FF|nr:LssY C-terminal domain-containing protein [Aestuariimicrobium ganziense]